MGKSFRFFLGALVVAIVGLSIFQAGEYGKVRAFTEKCNEAGGFVSTVQIGLITHRAQCSVLSVNEWAK